MSVLIKPFPRDLRWNAALLHLFFDAILLASMAALLFKHWFPPPFFTATGGWQGLKLAIPVMLIGPLLTFVVADPHKARKVLVRDLAMILVVQSLALAWGIHVLYGQRPVAVVFWESEFLTVTANDLSEQGYSDRQLDAFGNDRPVWVYRPKPVSRDGLRKILRQVTEEKVSPYYQVESFLPYREYFSDLVWHGVDIEKIARSNQNMKTELDAVLRQTGGKADDYIYLAMKSKYRNVVVVFSRNGERLGYLYAPYLQNP